MEPTPFTSAGHPLSGVVAGTGDLTPLVLLHAGVADHRSFLPMLGRLAEGRRVVAYDRRGFGATAWTHAPFTHLADLEAVLDGAAIEQAWLVGSSMGGGLAVDAALELPARVAGLVLFAPSVSGEPDVDDDALEPRTRELAEAIDAADAAGDLDRVNELEVQLWLDGPANPGRVQGAARQLALDMNRIALASGDDGSAGRSGFDAWARLGELTAPSTVAWGDLDLPDVVATMPDIARRMGAATEVVTGSAHLPYLEQPERCAAVVLDALERAR